MGRMGVPPLAPKDNISISHEDPQTTLNIEGQKLEFLLDTVATHCVPSAQKAPLQEGMCY